MFESLGLVFNDCISLIVVDNFKHATHDIWEEHHAEEHVDNDNNNLYVADGI